MRDPLRFQGALKRVTVSRTDHTWSIAILVETHDAPRRSESQAAVGVDLGISSLAVLSSGETLQGPKALGQLLTRLRRVSRVHISLFLAVGICLATALLSL